MTHVEDWGKHKSLEPRMELWKRPILTLVTALPTDTPIQFKSLFDCAGGSTIWSVHISVPAPSEQKQSCHKRARAHTHSHTYTHTHAQKPRSLDCVTLTHIFPQLAQRARPCRGCNAKLQMSTVLFVMPQRGATVISVPLTCFARTGARGSPLHVWDTRVRRRRRKVVPSRPINKVTFRFHKKAVGGKKKKEKTRVPLSSDVTKVAHRRLPYVLRGFSTETRSIKQGRHCLQHNSTRADDA